MKKATLVLVLAAIMLLSVVSMAFAVQGDSGYVPATGATYGNGTSPHGGYTATSISCAVCHAVHNASVAGEALLNSTRANACTYCHIDNYVSSHKAYPTQAAYTTAGPYGHNSAEGIACTDCHQTHGAVAQMFTQVYLKQKILKDITAANFSVGGTNVTIDSPSATRYYTVPLLGDAQGVAVSKWCSQCHAYYNAKTTLAANGATNGSSHVLTAVLTGYKGKAFAASSLCSSCHNANAAGTNGSNGLPITTAFPHYTAGQRFLTEAASSAAAPVPATDGTHDGVCLRCHAGDVAQTSGVGLSF